MQTALGLLAVIALVLANGYFVLAEFAQVAVKRGHLEDRASTGDKRAAKALQVNKQLNFMLSGAQLGITVTSLIIGFIAEDTVAAAIRPIIDLSGASREVRVAVSLGLALVLTTLFQMLIGELAPKNYAIAKPEQSAMLVSPSMLWFLRLTRPVITFFDSMANWTLKRVGIEPVEHVTGGVSSVAELDLIVGESAQYGQLTTRQANLLSRAIDFANLRAAAVMIPWNRVSTLPPELSGEELREVMAGAHSRYPVVDDRSIVLGTVHVKDLLHVDDEDDATISVGEIARPALVVPEVAAVRTVLDALRTESTEMAIIVDEYGAPAGIVTLEDLVEELVGEIGDEYDEEDDFAPIQQISPGLWRLAGTVRVDEVERATGIALPDGENFETVAGLMLERLQRVPEVGDRIHINDSELVVASMDHWSIEEIELAPLGQTTIAEDDQR